MSSKRKMPRAGSVPAGSEVPTSAPAPVTRDILPDPHIISPSLENIPQEALTESEQVADELDHAALDQELPGEDRAPAELG